MLIERQHEMFGVNTSDIDYIVNTARRMDVTPVMITLVNDAYLPFVYNWLCNTRDILLQRQVCELYMHIYMHSKLQKQNKTKARTQ